MIAGLIRWFRGKRRWQAPPGVIIVPYDITNADENQRLIMRFGLARSPEEATRLMQKYNVKSAGELIAVIPPRPRRSFKRRLLDLLRRMDGHDTRKLFESPSQPVQVTYLYREDYEHAKPIREDFEI